MKYYSAHLKLTPAAIAALDALQTLGHGNNGEQMNNHTALTPEQKLRASVAVILDGVDQHHVAQLYGVNQGRVNEAVQIARTAFGFEGVEDTRSRASDAGLSAVRKALKFTDDA